MLLSYCELVCWYSCIKCYLNISAVVITETCVISMIFLCCHVIWTNLLSIILFSLNFYVFIFVHYFRYMLLQVYNKAHLKSCIFKNRLSLFDKRHRYTVIYSLYLASEVEMLMTGLAIQNVLVCESIVKTKITSARQEIFQTLRILHYCKRTQIKV